MGKGLLLSLSCNDDKMPGYTDAAPRYNGGDAGL